MSGAPVNVLAMIDELRRQAALRNATWPCVLLKDLMPVCDAMAELIEADHEHDVSRSALIDINRRIAEHGWVDVESDALRTACRLFVDAQIRRERALARIGGAA